MSTGNGVEFGLALDFGVGSAASRLAEIRRLIGLAERHGFSSIWAGESYPTTDGTFHSSSPLIQLAALVSVTSLRLGTGVTLLPAWHPLRLAYDAAALDRISDGRLILGLGLGTRGLWRRFSSEAEDMGTWADEAAQALRALWKGESGYRGTLVNVEGGVAPLPVQPGGPPLWIGGRIPRAARRAAAFGDGWYGATNYRFREVERQARAYRQECERLGRRAGAVAINRLAMVGGSLDSVVGDCDAGLQEVVDSYVEMDLMLDLEGRPADPRRDPAGLLDFALVGDPDDVNRQVERYAAAGVSHIQARVLPGRTGIEVAERTIRLLGEEVLPAWRGDG